MQVLDISSFMHPILVLDGVIINVMDRLFLKLMTRKSIVMLRVTIEKVLVGKFMPISCSRLL